MAENEGKFELKSCFVKVTFNGKSKWDPPTEKNSQGLFSLGEAPSGVLNFDFCLNPAQLKETEKAIKKLTEAGNLEEAEKLIQNQSKPSEVYTLKSIQKLLPTEQTAISFFEMLLDRYQEGDDQNIMHMITNMTMEHSLWFSQAHESLYVCKFIEQAARVGPYLMSSIFDSHLRFAIIAQASQHGEELMNTLLSSIKARMGPSTMYWSCFNPNGHYRLDLGNPVERAVAKNLIVINKRNNAAIVAKERFDRSQTGNQSCFRNEKINNIKFSMHVPSWRLPETGVFEFDFQCFDQNPTADQESDKDDIVLLLEWFEATNEQLTNACKALGKHSKEALAQIGTILGECFRGVAEFFVFNCETLGLFVDLVDDPNWKFLVFTAGVGRMHDYQNFDFIKHRAKYPQVMKDVYSCFGLLNLFNPLRPNGSYMFNMTVYEERLVCKMICELSKGEGWGNWQDVKIDGKATDKLSNDFLLNLPTTGTFEGVYVCPVEKEKEELRVKLGQKYLDWVVE